MLDDEMTPEMLAKIEAYEAEHQIDFADLDPPEYTAFEDAYTADMLNQA